MHRAEELELHLPHRLAAKRWGRADLPPLLALHGWLDNAGSFDRLAPLLAERWCVVAIDLRGHGRSSHVAPDAWYHYVDYLTEVQAAIARLGWPRADLLGHSLGGTLACLLAAARPGLVDRLFLVEALGPPSTPAGDAARQLQRALQQQAAFGSRRPLRVFESVDQAVAVRMAASAMTEPAARPIVERGLVEADGGHVWSSDPKLMLASPQRFTEEQVRAMLAAVQAPATLVVADPPTRYLGTERMRDRVACVPALRTISIGTSHHLHLEQPDALARVLLDLAHVDAPAP